MKIIATIADDHQPKGWQETYAAPAYDATEDQCRQHMETMVARFNAGVRPGERPRRLLSIELAEHTAEEAWQLGYDAYLNHAARNPWPADHPNRTAWQQGWEDAEDDS